MRRRAGCAGAMWLLLALHMTSSVASEGVRPLSCPPSVLKDLVPVTCTDSGSVLAGRNVTYSFMIEEGEVGAFDLVLTLHTKTGDADLTVAAPGGQQFISRHGSGEDVIFIPRSRMQPGDYFVQVEGASDQSSYKLVVEKHRRQRSLAAQDRDTLQQVLGSACCSRPGSCNSLHNGLAAGSSDDLCNIGQNVCDVDGHLVHFAIVNEYLSCPFPAVLGQLERLTLLDLTMNDISGDLEADVVPVVRQLAQLENLLLGHNALTGSITCDLVTDSLAELDLAANQIQGSIPACLLESPSIQELYLGNNDLSGTLPQPPAGSNLLIISAYSMRLSGTLPDMSGLRQLQALQLHDNRLAGALPALPPALRHINLEYNSLSGSIPEQWGQLQDLELVRIRHNRLTGTVPAGLAQLPKLSVMLLSHNQLTGSLPTLWSTPQLQRLDLQRNLLAGPLPAALGSLPSLRVLQASYNRLAGSLAAFAEAAAARSALELLALNANQLTGVVPAQLQQLPVFGGGYAMIDGAAMPLTLELSDNQLSGALPSWVVPALAPSNTMVNLAGNRLECPQEVMVSEAVPKNRLAGLECIARDGSIVPVAGLVRVEDKPAGGGAAPGPWKGKGDADSSSAAAPAGSGPGTADQGSDGNGGWSGWAIAFTVVFSLAAAMWLAVAGPRTYRKWQAVRTAPQYQRFEPEQLSHTSTSAAAVAAKQHAVALAELHASKPIGSGRGRAAAGAPSSPTFGEGPFHIGTKVHHDEADMV